MDSSKRMAQKTMKINENPLNIKWNVTKIKWTVPDCSGKYHGKISSKTSQKISINATVGKKARTENYPI